MDTLSSWWEEIANVVAGSKRVKVGLTELIESSGAGLFLQIQSRERVMTADRLK